MKKFFKLNPINQKRWERFKNNRRGYICLWIFCLITFFSLFAEVFINNKPLMMKYNGEYHFPIFSSVKKGTDFGLSHEHEPNYVKLQKSFEGSDNWILMPLVPYNANQDDPIDQKPLDQKIKEIEKEYTAKIDAESDKEKLVSLRVEMVDAIEKFESLKYHPLPPNWSSEHYLGTDKNGRDIFARIVYGYRVAIAFAVLLLLVNYVAGTIVGCLMGYLGGLFDLLFQRVIEIITNIPFLYIVIIISAVMIQMDKRLGFFELIGIFAIFGWTGITWYMRTATYKERSREYVLAAKAQGASSISIILNHIIPNVISLLVTFIPFAVSGAIISLTSLDYLGFGLPKDYPSWGELIKQGTDNMDAYWIVLSVVSAMVVVLFLINSVGEAVRDAFDPKKISRYE